MAEHQASAAQRFFTDLLVAHLTSPHFVQDEAELRRIAEEGGFCPTTNRFAVLVVQIERWSNLFSSEAQWLEATKHHFFLLTNMLQELLDQENLAIIAEKDYQLVCLVNLRQRWPAFRSALLTLLQQMMEVMETEFDVSVSIAVSEEAAGLTGLPGAYQQALNVLWYNTFLEEDRQITFYEDLYGDLLPMIRSDLTVLDKKLITKLQLRDAAGVKYVLHEMIDREFLQETPTVKILRVRLGGLYDTVPGSRELYFRVSGANFDWLPQIRAFAEAHATEADTVTVLWDQESTGHSEYLTNEAGHTLDHVPLKEVVQ